MRGVPDNKAVEPAQLQQDADLTLGPVMLMGIVFVLLLIGATLFGAGYLVGSRGSIDGSAVMKPTPDAPASVQAGCVQAKPSASLQMDLAPDAVNPGDGVSPPVSAGPNAAPVVQAAESPAGVGGAVGQSQVKPALPGADGSSSVQLPGAGSGVGANTAAVVSPPGAIMVQIAAVSHQEDADVLVNALRKRGYAVGARRDADSMIHVRIGPFKDRDEAGKWSLKLMRDGYNAIVQP
jgi:cell division septation protein DedD